MLEPSEHPLIRKVRRQYRLGSHRSPPRGQLFRQSPLSVNYRVSPRRLGVEVVCDCALRLWFRDVDTYVSKVIPVEAPLARSNASRTCGDQPKDRRRAEQVMQEAAIDRTSDRADHVEIGRASCRERVEILA